MAGFLVGVGFVVVLLLVLWLLWARRRRRRAAFLPPDPALEASDSDVTLAALDGIELTFPGGLRLHTQMLPLRAAMPFLRLYEAHVGGNREAKYELVRTFPAAVGLVAECDRVTMEEFFDVLDQYFSARSWPPAAGARAQEPPAPTRHPQVPDDEPDPAMAERELQAALDDAAPSASMP